MTAKQEELIRRLDKIEADIGFLKLIAYMGIFSVAVYRIAEFLRWIL